jgi:very-short-patch-repair endonuclease/predicted transcriptional regulator of viral defense system
MEEERISVGLTDPQTCAPPADAVVRDLADHQHGVVARRQLLEAGLTSDMVKNRLERGQLLPLHRGVYAVGHRRLRREGHWLAAVLAVGPGAVLSHRDAAALHGIRPANRPTIDVTTAARGRRDRPGITLHRATFHTADITILDAIPVTTVARTLVDLATTVPPDHLAKALSEAERLQLLDLDALKATRVRTYGRHGTGDRVLRKALAEHAKLGTTLTRSSLEDRFATLVRRAGLRNPLANLQLHGIEVDALWPEQRLVVELDGYAYHHTRRAFQRDRTKDALLATAGYTVVRFTHDDVVRRPERVANTLAELLGGPSAVRATMSGSCR